MPGFTPHYYLTSFYYGDIYSAKADKSRFTIIDNQVSFLSDIIGNGIISGWGLSDSSSSVQSSITVTPGWGMINRFITNTYGNLNLDVDLADSFYVYMIRKDGAIPNAGPFSDIFNVSYTDTVAPSAPTDFSGTSTYNSIVLSWTENTEPDISHYIIERLEGSYESIATVTTTNYIDTGLEQDQLYNYKIYAVDYSGNISDPTYLVIATAQDLNVPVNPLKVFIFERSDSVQLLWQHSPSLNLDSYQVSVQELDEERNPIGAITTQSIPLTDTKCFVEGLEESKLYKIILYSVNVNSVLSYGVEFEGHYVINNGDNEIDHDVSLNAAESEENPGWVALTIDWEDEGFSDLDTPSGYAIIIIENGETFSDPIILPYDNLISHSKTINAFEVNGVAYPVKDRTYYLAKVQSIDNEGDYSNGAVSQVITSSYRKPFPPKDITSEIQSFNLVFSWTNSSSVYSSNFLTVVKEDISSGVSETLLSQNDIGKESTYVIDSEDIEEDIKYTVSVFAIDEFNNESDVVSGDYSTSTSYPEPHPLRGINTFSGDSRIVLTWEKPTDIEVKSYRVWRANYNSSTLISSNWSLVATLPWNINEYVDYGVVNANSYYYVITIIDVYNNETTTPLDSGWTGGPFYTASSVTEDEDITSVNGLDITFTPGGYNAYLTWAESIEQFDGYEIYRSDSENRVWVKAGSVLKGIEEYVDEDALLKDGVIYYYMVRKYNNEAYLSTSYSSTVPFNGICLGRVVLDDSGYIESVNTDCAVDISNLSGAADRYIDAWLDTHHHLLTDSIDKRIDLNNNIVVTSWATNNYQVYTTTEDISGATSYVAKVNDEITTLFYEVDEDESTITFESALTSTDTISLICLGVNETQGTLPASKVGEVFATQMEESKLDVDQIPIIDHYGRKSEQLIPLQKLMSTKNMYTFTIAQNALVDEVRQEDVGVATTFYYIDEASVDVVQNDVGIDDLTLDELEDLTIEELDNMLLTVATGGSSSGSGQASLGRLAATSRGVLYSDDSGETWTNVLTPDSPVHKLFYSEQQLRYFAVAGASAYVSNNGINWVRTSGLESVCMVRDICESGLGEVFVSTDKGVFRLEEDVASSATVVYDNIRWVTTPYFDEVITDCYAIWFDDFEDLLYVSTPIGLFNTADDVISWSQLEIADEKQPFQSILQNSGYIFAITNNGIWRKGSDSISTQYFEKIAELPTALARRIVIYENKLYITTDLGLLASEDNYNIYTDGTLISSGDGRRNGFIQFSHFLPNVTYKYKLRIPTLLNVVNSLLYVGFDNELFVTDTDLIPESIYETTGIAPTLYIDGYPRELGIYYDIYENEVIFDTQISELSRVTIANQYTLYKAENGGWLEQLYDAEVILHKNQAVYGGTKQLASVPSNVSTPAFEDFTEADSNSVRADEYVLEYNALLSSLSVDGADTHEIVRELVSLYRKVYSQVIGNIRFGSTRSISSLSYPSSAIVGDEISPYDIYETLFEDYEIVPDLASEDIGVDGEVDNYLADATTGLFIFPSSLTKDDNVIVDIKNVEINISGTLSHDELDTYVENVNSGLSARLADVQEGNIAKLAAAIERDSVSEITRTDSYGVLETQPTQLDVLPFEDRSDWYDKLNSTVEFDRETYNLGESIKRGFLYPTAVLYDSTSLVYVGFTDALLTIDSITFEITIVDYDGVGGYKAIRNIFQDTSTIYVVTDYYIYSYDGIAWEQETTRGLTGELRGFMVICSQDTAITTDGIYYKDVTLGYWVKSSTLSSYYMRKFDYGFILSGRKLSYTVDGVTIISRGEFEDIDVNAFDRYRENFVLATSKGLRYDNSSFYQGDGEDVPTTLIDLETDIFASESVIFNDVSVNSAGTGYVAGANDGTYWTYDGSSYNEGTDSGLQTIHKVLYVGNAYWLFGFNLLKVSTEAEPIDLSGGEIF